jgi:hypothetical protein
VALICIALDQHIYSIGIRIRTSPIKVADAGLVKGLGYLNFCRVRFLRIKLLHGTPKPHFDAFKLLVDRNNTLEAEVSNLVLQTKASTACKASRLIEFDTYYGRFD